MEHHTEPAATTTEHSLQRASEMIYLRYGEDIVEPRDTGQVSSPDPNVRRFTNLLLLFSGRADAFPRPAGRDCRTGGNRRKGSAPGDTTGVQSGHWPQSAGR